jgi:hypothetical protein
MKCFWNNLLWYGLGFVSYPALVVAHVAWIWS